MPVTWILVVYLLGSPVTGYSVPGWVAKMDCDKAGEQLVVFHQVNKLPPIKFTCLEQPRTR